MTVGIGGDVAHPVRAYAAALGAAAGPSRHRPRRRWRRPRPAGTPPRRACLPSAECSRTTVVLDDRERAASSCSCRRCDDPFPGGSPRRGAVSGGLPLLHRQTPCRRPPSSSSATGVSSGSRGGGGRRRPRHLFVLPPRGGADEPLNDDCSPHVPEVTKLSSTRRPTPPYPPPVRSFVIPALIPTT